MSYSVPLSCNECCPRCGIQKKIIFHASLDTLLQIPHLSLVIGHTELQQYAAKGLRHCYEFECF